MKKQLLTQKEDQIAQLEREVEVLKGRLKVLNNEQLNDDDLNRATLEELVSRREGGVKKVEGALTPQDSLRIIRDRMRDLEREFGLNIGEDGVAAISRKRSLNAVVASTSTANDPTVSIVRMATITYGSESQTFRLSDTTTFNDLCEDACRVWKVSGAALRDENNAVWPGTGVVKEEIAKYLRESGGNAPPTLLLFTRIVSNPSSNNAQGDGFQQQQPQQLPHTLGQGTGHHSSAVLSSRRSSAASLGVSSRKLSAMVGSFIRARTLVD